MINSFKIFLEARQEFVDQVQDAIYYKQSS